MLPECAANGCKVGLDPEREHIEALSQKALAGEISWRAVSRETGLRAEGIRNHMLKHVVQPEVQAEQRAVTDKMEELIAEAREELEQQFYIAPPDVKPLILVAIQNLDGLRDTTPSQANLVKALKTIQEMTGMKNEQRMLLGYAQAMFGKVQPLAVEPFIEVPALEAGEED